MNQPRSTLRLDLKDLAPPPAPNTSKVGLVVATGLLAGAMYALFSALISVNSPSASAALSNTASTTAQQTDSDSSWSTPLTTEPHYQAVPNATQNTTKANLFASAQQKHKPLTALVLKEQKPDQLLVNQISNITSKEPETTSSSKHDAASPAQKSHSHDNRVQSESKPMSAVPSDIDSSQKPTSIDQPSLLTDMQEDFSGLPNSSDTATHSTDKRQEQQADSPPSFKKPSQNNLLQLASLSPTPGQRSASALTELLKSKFDESTVEPLPDPLIAAMNEGEWVTETIRKKDTLTSVLKRLGFGIREALALIKLEHASVLERIHPGQMIHITRLPPATSNGKERLGKLKFQLSQYDTLLIRRQDDNYVADVVRREPEVRYRIAQAIISRDLIGAAKQANIPRKVIYSLASILDWQVDFSRDILPGDRLKVIYEELYLDGNLVEPGQIVALELTIRQKKIQAVRHVYDSGHTTYFTPAGEGIQGSFLRSPIKFARVTSNFSKRRLHPIAKIWKPHKGVDYGAPMNTPIRSTGDGVVEYAGTKTGYGKTVILRHGMKYKTLYAHLNRFQKGVNAGQRVKQGDVIGYVGKTGWATGPHLHYEFRVNGRHMNPLTVELPKSLPIEPSYKDQFVREAALWVAKLEKNDQPKFVQRDLGNNQ